MQKHHQLHPKNTVTLVTFELLEFFRIIERGAESFIQGLDVPIKLFTAQ